METPRPVSAQDGLSPRGKEAYRNSQLSYRIAQGIGLVAIAAGAGFYGSQIINDHAELGDFIPNIWQIGLLGFGVLSLGLSKIYGEMSARLLKDAQR